MEDTTLLPASIASDKAAQVFENDEFNRKLINLIAAKIKGAADKGKFTCDVVLSNAILEDSYSTDKLNKVMGTLADYMTYSGYTVDGIEPASSKIRISWANHRA